LILILIAGAACEGGREPGDTEGQSAAADTAAGALLRELPHAALIRFRETKGAGFTRESWEIEILQTDSDVWIQGAVRAGGKSVPFKESMPLAEYHDLWTWLRGLELETLQIQEDSTRAQEGWRKTLVLDIVESSNRRIQTKSAWFRTPLGRPELSELERRLHDLLLRSSERELERMAAESKEDTTRMLRPAGHVADSTMTPQ
jgi:hypothetical protein